MTALMTSTTILAAGAALALVGPAAYGAEEVPLSADTPAIELYDESAPVPELISEEEPTLISEEPALIEEQYGSFAAYRTLGLGGVGAVAATTVVIARRRS